VVSGGSGGGRHRQSIGCCRDAGERALGRLLARSTWLLFPVTKHPGDTAISSIPGYFAIIIIIVIIIIVIIAGKYALPAPDAALDMLKSKTNSSNKSQQNSISPATSSSCTQIRVADGTCSAAALVTSAWITSLMRVSTPS
jgi:hypothetical protein